MLNITKYNQSEQKFDLYEGQDVEYSSLKEAYAQNGKDKIYQLDGFFINPKTKFGEQAVACCGATRYNLPSHLTETVKEIMNDDETVAEINSKRVGFEISEYEAKKYKTLAYSIKFKAIEVEDILEDDMPF